MLIGIDEVGRGCWAGPLLVVAATSTQTVPAGLADSKVITKRRRELLFTQIQNTCTFGEGWVEPSEIDQLGLTAAMRLGVARALSAIRAQSTDEIIMDGLINYCDPHFELVTCVAKADSLYPIVSAASIHAKVRRDACMAARAKEYPAFGFDSHVGYGTATHSAALQQYGPTPLHRLSYRPVAKFVKH